MPVWTNLFTYKIELAVGQGSLINNLAFDADRRK